MTKALDGRRDDRVVKEASEVGDRGLGLLLRRGGLHEATLAEFRQEVLENAAKGY